MNKKILIVVGAIFLIFFVILGVTTCGVMKVAEEALREREPQLRQYVQMTEDEQNIYITKNIDSIFASISTEIKPDDKKFDRETFEKIKNDSEITAAGIKLGRSIIAMFIISSENIMKDLSAENKSKFKSEFDEMEKRIEFYVKLIEKKYPTKK